MLSCEESVSCVVTIKVVECIGAEVITGTAVCIDEVSFVIVDVEAVVFSIVALNMIGVVTIVVVATIERVD